MTISLVSAPVLGFDLVRHPAGSAVAETLLLALSLGPQDLARFEQVARTLPAPRQAELAAARERLGAGSLRGSVVLPGTDEAVDGPLGGMISTLRRSMISDLDDLEHLVRTDVLAWAEAEAALIPAAGEALAGTVRIVVEALAADWVDGLSDELRTELAAGLRRATAGRTPVPVDIGPCRPELDAVLNPLRRLDPDGRDRLRQVSSLLGPGGAEWAQSVHEASWAAFSTGRIRAAASAQLLAVQAFRAGGLTAADGAEGVWNMISGHVQACVVADVLPEEVRHRLGRGWRAA
ncbi:MAG TPA: hypothetical protein VHO01_05210, partial [Jatrophihabitans sp.]|nr:hypothetical protein [Jatrophihabitans sp.]